MRLLRVEKIEPMGTFSVIHGVVENELILVGQSVTFVSKAGQRDAGILTAIMPNDEGMKEFDQGSPGRKVKVTLRRKQPTFPDADIVAIEKLATA